MNLSELTSPTKDEETEPQEPRFILRNAAFALQPQEPIEYIVNQLLSAGSVSLFYGEPGSKKTYALLSLAVCVAMGKPWLGFDVVQRKVLIIDEESGERRLTLRLAASIRGELGDESIPLEFVSLANFKLDSKTDAKEIQELINTTGAGLVIIDALADVMDGDENSKQDTQPVFTALRRLAEHTSAAIVVIHHSNKMGGYRGSSAIKGSLDLMVKISSENESNFIDFTSEKSRDSEPVKFSAMATWTDTQFYLSPAEQRIKPQGAGEQFVLKILSEKGPLSIQEIEELADTCSPATARSAVYKLAQAGSIYRTNRGGGLGRGKLAIYALKDGAGDD